MTRAWIVLGLGILPACTVGDGGLGFGLRSYEVGEARAQSLVSEGKRSRRAKVDLDFGPGELKLRPGGSAAVQVESHGNVRELEPVLIEREWAGQLGVELRPREPGRGLPLWDWDEFENTWEVMLSPDLPLDLDLQVGAGESELELGGLAIERLRMELGVGEARIDFSEPNTRPMESLSIEAGTASVVIGQLGNANARRIDFDGGLGQFELHLDGEWREPALMVVDTGLSELKLCVPSDLPVRVVADTSLADVTPVGFRERGGAWVNRACERSDAPWVEIEVDLAMGSLILVED